MPSPVTVIGIPTFRRPDLLRRLLSSLAPEVTGKDVLVVVGDNDAGTEAPAVVADFSVAGCPPAECVPVDRPGIAHVRNTLVRTALDRRPTWELLVMLDDDGYVTPGWFDALMTAVDTFDADVTAGPVLGELPPGASLLARNSIYAGRRRHPSGPVPMLNGAQNIAIRRRIVDTIGDPWFPVHLGRAGGEDYFFFRSVLDQGGSLAWCDEAAVFEPTPATRLTSSALLRRAYRSNMVGTQTDLAFQAPSVVARRFAVDAGWYARNLAAGLVLRDPDRLAKSVLDAASLAGRATGFLRRRTPEGSHAGL